MASATVSKPTTLAQTLSTGLKRKLTPTHIEGIPVSILESAQKAPKDRPIVSPKRCQIQVSSTASYRADNQTPSPLPAAPSAQVKSDVEMDDEDDDSDDDVVIVM